MAQDKYFREELSFLKEQGKQFTQIHPQLSRYLQGQHADPDVERLLEGFAFLTARLRQKVEDQFPELTHSMINMLWPNYLRPIPSTTVMRFTPDRSLSERQVIKKGTQLDSNAVFGTSCHFRTCRDVEIYPLVCEDVITHRSRKATTINIELNLLGGVTFGEAGIDNLGFYLGGDAFSAQMIYFWINHYLESIEVDVQGTSFNIPVHGMGVLGFDSQDSVLPYTKNAHEGYRILQEYLSYPDLFNFVKINGLSKSVAKGVTGNFTLKLHFNKTIPSNIYVSDEQFQLYCVPAINLFEHDADPIDLSGKKAEYKLIPSSRTPSHYEVFSVDQVFSWQDSKDSKARHRGQRRDYKAFESFQHEIERVQSRQSLYYRVRVKDSIRSDGFDHFISFVRADETYAVDMDESVSLKLTCTNRQLPMELGIGDICQPTDTSPPYATFENITRPTQTLRPMLDGSLQWMLISNLSLNYLSLQSKEALSSILQVYDFKALVDRQAEKVANLRLASILKVESQPVDRIVKGLSVRGLKTILVLDPKCFVSEGELYLFGTVLNHFFALYASINSFHQLEIVNSQNQERYTWDIRQGQQPLL
ncbi:type VI secretion system baseplate subunit TssF [Vibrio intestinalis]|uniref:type VI secretion system baseplate subunit TssF n=1 Tax=Vibrio intestinalis TaxID=2933291 RepID=UPI0021A5D97A|nr:type VI secretion system baseplate subunit TssF [Vibrio intestinalis]